MRCDVNGKNRIGIFPGERESERDRRSRCEPRQNESADEQAVLWTSGGMRR